MSDPKGVIPAYCSYRMHSRPDGYWDVWVFVRYIGKFILPRISTKS